MRLIDSCWIMVFVVFNGFQSVLSGFNEFLLFKWVWFDFAGFNELESVYNFVVFNHFL